MKGSELIKNTKIAIVGLGYVGLPLAAEFGKKIPTIGFDINQKRIVQLKKGIDSSKELSKKEIKAAKKLTFTNNLEDLKEYNFFIVAVPTPINDSKFPDLTPLEKASEALGKILKKNDVIVYESTVYPGATEEVCVPILEQESGLKFNKDFYVGYSPERISPSDKNNITEIVKVTSGSTPKIAKHINEVYRSIIKAGTFLADNIKTAEACKVMENIYRDINIAHMNEVAMLCRQLGINTQNVIAAMKTKWNASPFVPGFVGGHCIGVDPYYLITKAQSIGFDMSLAKSARVINDEMPSFIATQLITEMCKKSINTNKAKVLIMGATFKENCSDIRNARPFDVAKQLENFDMKVDIYDPTPDKEEVFQEYGKKLIDKPKAGTYDAIIITVAHDIFKKMGPRKIRNLGKGKAILYDVKAIFDRKYSDLQL